MADERKISGLTEATDASASDEFVVVNKAVTEGADASASGQTSKITLDNLRKSIFGGGSGEQGLTLSEPLTIVEKDNVALKMLKSSGQTLFTIGEDGGNNVVLDSSTVDLSGNVVSSDLVIKGGNVGIGNPAQLNRTLNVHGSIGLTGRQFIAESIEDTTEFSAGNVANPILSVLNVSGLPNTHSSIKLGSSTISAIQVGGGSGSDTAWATDMAFYVNEHSHQRERMRISASGNVAIGTQHNSHRLTLRSSHGDSPHGSLRLVGTPGSDNHIRFDYPSMLNPEGTLSDNLDTVDYWLVGADSSGTFSDDFIIFNRKRNSVDFLVEHDTGNVLISNKSAVQKTAEGFLHITGEANSARPLIVDRGTFATKDSNGNPKPVVGGFVWQEFRHNNIADWWITGQVALDGDGQDRSVLNFQSQDEDGSNENVLTLHPNGYVGIGEHNPSGNLTVKNATQHGATSVRVWNSGDGLPGDAGLVGAYTSYGTKTNNDATGPDYSYYTGIDMTHTGIPSFRIGYAHHKWAAPNWANDLFVLTSGGRCGIGSAFSVNAEGETPAVKGLLHLEPEVSTGENPSLIFNYGSNMFSGATANDFGISYADNLHIGTEHNDAPVIAMTFKSNGRVVTPQGSVTTTGFDAKDLGAIRASEVNALEKLNDLVVSDFEKDGVTQTGIVAQDMRKVLPHSVSGGEEYEAIEPARGMVVANLGAEDEYVYENDTTIEAYEAERGEIPGDAEFVETKASQAEMRRHLLATSNDELVAMLVKAVQELSAELNELKSK